MTAINVLIQSGVVHMMTDGAAYDRNGVVCSIAPKVFALPHINAAIAIQGPTVALPLLAHQVGHTASTYDQMKRDIVAMLKQAYAVCEQTIERLAPTGTKMFVMIAGISETHGPDAFSVAYSAGIWSMSPIGPISLLLATPESCHVARQFGHGVNSVDEIDPEAFGVAVMKAQRTSAFEGSQPDRARIGGFVQLTSIAKDDISTRVVHRWSDDRPGEIMDPGLCGESGVIGALGVKSLSIGDYAVTVPRTQTFGNMLGPGSQPNFCNFDISFDTTGLAGKEMCVFASCTATLLYADTTGLNAYTELIIQTTVVSQNQTIDRSGVIAMSGAYTFIATGGPMTFNVRANAGLGSNVVMTFRTLYAVVGKR